MGGLTTFYFTQEEIHALAIALARSVDSRVAPSNAHEAAAVIWANRDRAGQILCSTATALAEAAYGQRD